jgi:predicted DNA-binding transcriptional regulator AlpA
VPKHKTNPRRGKPPVNHRTNGFVEKAQALKAANVLAVRLLGKPEVMAITGTSYPTIWQWMRDGKFPRSRIHGGRSMWLSTEINDYLAGLPLRPLKGDQPEAA